jgi:hypothetical protein
MYADGHIENLGRARESLLPRTAPFMNLATSPLHTAPSTQVRDTSAATTVDESGLWSLLRLDDAGTSDDAQSDTRRTQLSPHVLSQQSSYTFV